MHMVNRERTVTVELGALVTKMKENRARHSELYLEAMEGYRDECVRVCKSASKEAHEIAARGDGLLDLQALQALRPPVSYLKAYDEAITLFEWECGEQEVNTAEKVIDLTVTEFRSYVLDEWAWAEGWHVSNAGRSANIMAVFQTKYR